MPPKQRKDVNKGKNIASSSLPDPAVTNQVNRPPPAAVTNEGQANPTTPATEQPAAITRADLDRVVVEVTNRFTSQQEALVDHLMSRLRDAEESNRNTESWGESQSGGSQRQQRSSFFEGANGRSSRGRSRDRAQPEVRPEETFGTEPNGEGTGRRSTVAEPVMLPNHRNTSERGRARVQPEVGPEEVLRSEPNRGRSRQGPTVADPSMLPEDQRQPLENMRNDRRYHPYRSSGRNQSHRTEPNSFLSAPSSDERMARLFRECVQREQRDRGIGARVTSPFARNIEIAITPREWKMPTMEPYKGTSDPVVHLQRYTQHMLMSGATEGVLCKCFLLFLADLVTSWFCHLPQGSISSWEMLKEKFISQFRIHVEQPKDAYSLSSVKQKPGEKLQQYLTRFNAAAAAVQDADEKLILMALCSGVHPDTKFARRLTKEKPATLPDFFH